MKFEPKHLRVSESILLSSLGIVDLIIYVLFTSDTYTSSMFLMIALIFLGFGPLNYLMSKNKEYELKQTKIILGLVILMIPGGIGLIYLTFWLFGLGGYFAISFPYLLLASIWFILGGIHATICLTLILLYPGDDFIRDF